jgi:hypothetical protein
VKHISSTEKASAPLKFIICNMKPQRIFTDVLSRDPKELQRVQAFV